MTTRPRTRANGEGSIYPYRVGFAAYVWVATASGERRRKYVYGPTREIVHEKWLALHRQAREGPVATRVPTVGAFLEYWLREVVQPNRAPLTFATYETLVRLYVAPGLGGKRLDRLSVRDVQTWLNRVRQSCQCCAQGKDGRRPESRRRCCAIGKCCGQMPSARTAKDLRAVLRSALSQAMTEGMISRNVAVLVKLPSSRSRKASAWSSEEARAFVESARIDADPLYAAYVLVLVLGLRKGEVLGLLWDDIDFDEERLVIGAQLQRVGRRLLHRETKTAASDAALPLPSICMSALRLRAGEQEKAAKAADLAWQGSKFVFTTRFGMPVEPRTFNRRFAARCVNAGVRPITVHDARGTCATLLVDLDVHPRVIMQVLRHAQFAVTMEVYARVSSASTREALRRLGESLDG